MALGGFWRGEAGTFWRVFGVGYGGAEVVRARGICKLAALSGGLCSSVFSVYVGYIQKSFVRPSVRLWFVRFGLCCSVCCEICSSVLVHLVLKTR